MRLLTGPLLLAPTLLSALFAPLAARADSAAVPDAVAPSSAPAAESPFVAPPASCTREGAVELRGKVYLPCADDGVVEGQLREDGSFAAQVQYRVAGRVLGLFVRGAEVWIEQQRVEAQPLAQLRQTQPTLESVAAAASGAPARLPIPDSSARQGEVRELHGRELTVSLGARDGLKLGDHVELYQRRSEAKGGERETSLAVGEVVAVARDDARVGLGLGEEVPTASLARPTTRGLTRSLIAPPRMGGLMIIEGAIRPYLPIGTLGIGVLGDIAVTYAAKSPFYARVELRPIGGIVSSKSTTGILAGHVLAGYDHQYFAVGIGAGLVYADRSDWRRNQDDSMDVGPAFSIKQATRLGARDGLRLTVDNAFVLGGKEWHYAFVDVGIQIPLGTRTWLALNGGGGKVGRYFQGELGLRRLLLGSGGPRSLFVLPSVGIAGVGRTTTTNWRFDMGPMVGVQIEWRQ